LKVWVLDLDLVDASSGFFGMVGRWGRGPDT
jgi:hypothetical protein